MSSRSAYGEQHAARHHAPEHPVPRRRDGRPRARSSKRINESLLSTLAACGDVNRNVIASPTPAYTKAREAGVSPTRTASRCARAADARPTAPSGSTASSSTPTTRANKNFEDPLYGKTYLPRKFKVAFVIPPVNDMDVFTNCLGFIAVVEDDQLSATTSWSAAAWAARTATSRLTRASADVIGFFTPRQMSWTSRRPC
jgi:sulfite reductase (NADPH) hemoprotein beta-component